MFLSVKKVEQASRYSGYWDGPDALSSSYIRHTRVSLSFPRRCSINFISDAVCSGVLALRLSRFTAFCTIDSILIKTLTAADWGAVLI